MRVKQALKVLGVIFAVSVLLAAVIIGSIALYMRLYGNAHIKQALTDLVGARVNFKSAALNLEKQAASFKGVTIASEIGFGGTVFDADIFTIIFSKEKAGPGLAVERIFVKGAKLHIVRDKAGVLNIAIPTVRTASAKEPAPGFVGTAYAEEAPAKNGLYAIAKSVKDITIEDSVVTFEDRFKMDQPYKIWCDRFYAEVKSTDTGAGYFSTGIRANFRLPQKRYGDGWFGVKANLAVYPDKTNVELQAGTGTIDLLIFQPYFLRNTPFSFRSGRFGSQTDLRLHDGAVDSLTTMYLSDLRFAINQHDPNAQFLQVSINRLAPYLSSGDNLVFDFVMKGDIRRPEFSAGPKVKFAVGMVVMEEVGKAIQQIQKLQK